VVCYGLTVKPAKILFKLLVKPIGVIYPLVVFVGVKLPELCFLQHCGFFRHKAEIQPRAAFNRLQEVLRVIFRKIYRGWYTAQDRKGQFDRTEQKYR